MTSPNSVRLWLFPITGFWLLTFSLGYTIDDLTNFNSTCSWNVQLLKLHDDPKIGLRKAEQLDVRNVRVNILDYLDAKRREELEEIQISMGFRHMLLIEVYCGGEYSTEVSLLIADQDFRLSVHVQDSTVDRDGIHTGVVDNTLQAALVDRDDLFVNESTTCQQTICTPVWVIPLPTVDKSTYLKIQVDEEPELTLTKPLEIYFILNPFLDENQRIKFAERVDFSSTFVRAIKTRGMKPLLSKISSMEVLSLGIDVVLISDGESETSYLYNYSGLLKQNNIKNRKPLSCSPGSADSKLIIYSTAVKSSVIFFATNYGLIQLSFIGEDLVTYPPISICLSELKIPGHDFTDPHELMGAGITNGSYVLFKTQSHRHAKNTYRSLPTATLNLDFCPPSSCKLLDLTYDGLNVSKIIILIERNTASGIPHYELWRWTSYIDMSNSSREDVTVNETKYLETIYGRLEKQPQYRLYHAVTNNTNTTNKSVPSESDSIRANIKEGLRLLCRDCDTTIPLKLRGIAIHTLPSPGYVLFGSHVLYGFQDGDYRCISPPERQLNFTFVTSDNSGLFVAFSNNPVELWVWAIHTWSLRRVYPSYGWDIYHRESGAAPHKLDSFTIINLAFRRNNKLQILMLDESVTGRNPLITHSISIPTILRYDDTDSQYFFQDGDEEHSSGYSSVRRCDHSETIYDGANLLEKTSIMYMDWHLFPVPRANNRYSQRFTDIIMYQTLIYNILLMGNKRNESTKLSTLELIYKNALTEVTGNESYTKELDQYSFGVIKATNYEQDHGHLSTDATNLGDLPHVIYLDRGEEANFTIILRTVSSSDIERSFDKLDISVELTSNNLIHVVTTKVERFTIDGAEFQVLVKTKDRSEDGVLKVEQDTPGYNLVHVTLLLRMAYTQLNCPKSLSDSTYLFAGLQNIDVLVGCPPHYKIFFDEEESIAQLKLKENHLSCLGRNTTIPCFYFQHLFYPRFSIENLATGEKRPFRGKYLLTVIGGGVNEMSLADYSKSEVRDANRIPLNGSNDKLMITPDTYYPRESYEEFPVYTIQYNAIKWYCDTSSNCASPPPGQGGVPEYIFHFQFTNEKVDDSTQCLFEFQFYVKAFGYKIGQQDYAVILGTLSVLFLHLLCYYFWKTRTFWLANLHSRDNTAINKLLSIGTIGAVASRSSIKKNLLEAIYQDDALYLSDAIRKAEDHKPFNKSRLFVSPSMQSIKLNLTTSNKDKAAVFEELLKRRLEQQTASHDIRGIGITLGEIARLGIPVHDQEMIFKAKKILVKKAHIVLKLVESFNTKNYKEIWEYLQKYREDMPPETADNNPLVQHAMTQVSALLTKQLLQSLKKKDTWEIHFAITEFKHHNVNDQYGLIPKAEHVIYHRLTAKLRKAIKQGTPQILRDAVVDTERELDFHLIEDKEGVIDEAKTLLYKILRDKLAEELKRRDSMKIRNAINRFAFYGVTDPSGFLEKANRNLYQLVIPPIAKNLSSAKTPDELHRLVTKIRLELNRYGLKDEEKIAAKAEKTLYDAIAKQLQSALRNKVKPPELAVVLSAFIMSKQQYKITQDVRKLEEVGKLTLYKQLIPFLVNNMNNTNVSLEQLNASITAAKIEFSRLGLQDPGDLIEKAQKKLYELAFNPLRECLEYNRDVKELWSRIRSCYTYMRDFGITDSDNIIAKAENKLAELIHMDIEDAVIRHDAQVLIDLKAFLRGVIHTNKLELLQQLEKNLKNLNTKLVTMNKHLVDNETEYARLCVDLAKATDRLKRDKNLQAIMPFISRFEQSGFPDRDGKQKAALRTVADLVDEQFKANLSAGNYSKVALLRDVINSVAMEPRQKDVFFLLTVVCGKYLSIKAELDTNLMARSAAVKKTIVSLEQILKNLKVLKQALQHGYLDGILSLEHEMRDLIGRAEELASYLQGIEQIKQHLHEMNPSDLVQLEKYRIVPKMVLHVLQSFLILLGSNPDNVKKWVAVRKEISAYNNAAHLLEKAKNIKLTTNELYMTSVLVARELCNPYLDQMKVDEDSSAEHQTLSIIIRWMLWAINESTVNYVNHIGKLEPLIAKAKATMLANAPPTTVNITVDLSQPLTLHGQVLSAEKMKILKTIVTSHKDVLHPKYSALYISRFVIAGETAGESVSMLRECLEFKRSMDIFNLSVNYSPHLPLSKHVPIIEHSGNDRKGNPVFVFQLSQLDLEGLINSCLPCQFIVHALFHLELAEDVCKVSGTYNSILVIDCSGFTSSIAYRSLAEVFSWINIIQHIMCRYYPNLFSTIFLVGYMRLKALAREFQMNLLDPSPGFNARPLDDTEWKSVLHDLIPPTSLPASLDGSYNRTGTFPQPTKIPGVFDLSLDESMRGIRKQWLRFNLDVGDPHTLTFKQANYTFHALLYLEFNSDIAINLLVSFSALNSSERKTVLNHNSITGVYSRLFNAESAGNYMVTISNTNSGSHLRRAIVSYQIGLANTSVQLREFAYKLEADSNGNIIDLLGRGNSHHFLNITPS